MLDEAGTGGNAYTEGILKHPYYGSQAVITDLKALPGFDSGLVQRKQIPKRFPLKTKLWLPTQSWSLMEMPKPQGMTTPPGLVNSSGFTLQPQVNFVVVTLNPTC